MRGKLTKVPLEDIVEVEVDQKAQIKSVESISCDLCEPKPSREFRSTVM